MPRRKLTFDVAVNTPSAQREADRLANIFKTRLQNIPVGTRAGNVRGSGGGAGGGSNSLGMPGSSVRNLIQGGFQFALAGHFYQFFSNLPKMIPEIDRLATANRRATASFNTLAGGADEANAMIVAFQQGSGNTADRMTATTEAMRLFNIGMAQSAEQMRAFVMLSRGMSQALGKPVEYIQEQFSLALANQSELRFDQLGLSLVRHKELMKQISAEYPDLSQEIVFQNAMLTQASEKYFKLALAQEALATSTEIATRNFKDFWNVLAEAAASDVIAPLTAQLAKLTGGKDYNIEGSIINAQNKSLQREMEGYQAGNFAFTQPLYDMMGWDIDAENNAKAGAIAARIELGNSLQELGNTLQAAANMGMEIDPQWAANLAEGIAVYNDLGAEVGGWTGRIEATSMIVRDASSDTDGLTESLMRMSTASQIAEGQIASLNDRLLGAQIAMIGKLIEAGVDPSTVAGMAASEAEIFDRAKELQEQGALSGDAISDEIALATAEKELLQEQQNTLDAMKEAESESSRAAKALESAAKKAEKAFVDAADEIVSAYDKMLRKVPGLYGRSEVSEEDLRLAELGIPINYADDALRRLEDVGFNKKKRDDVDLGLWERVLGMPAGTDPEILALLAGKKWNTGELAANPEFMKSLYNLDAIKADLHAQEIGALGTRNLDAWLGLPTEGGNEFLEVFGMQAMNPIEAGLITEITTRGPVMGETLANAMYQGFKSESLSLPWVQAVMDAVNSEVGRRVLEQMNSNGQSDLADAEGIPVP